MSLNKIGQHALRDVWLYVPNGFYERADQVHKQLEAHPAIRKLSRNNTGWTLLTTTETGKQLIREGFTYEDVHLRFIYAKKNLEDNNPPPKMQKKVTWVQKNADPPKSVKSSFSAVSSQRGDGEEIVEKDKKKKWVQKNKIEPEVLKPSYSSAIEFTQASKDEEAEEEVPTSPKNPPKIQSFIESRAVEEKADELRKVDEDSSSTESLERRLKKRNKKKKKGRGSVGAECDRNNPFSSLIK